MVNQAALDSFETLEFFFEDDIMLQRFMEYFNEFTLEIDYSLYKNAKVRKLILEGLESPEIAKEVGLPYNSVWRARDRFLKKHLSKHGGDKDK